MAFLHGQLSLSHKRSVDLVTLFLKRYLFFIRINPLSTCFLSFSISIFYCFHRLFIQLYSLSSFIFHLCPSFTLFIHLFNTRLVYFSDQTKTLLTVPWCQQTTISLSPNCTVLELKNIRVKALVRRIASGPMTCPTEKLTVHHFSFE